MRGFGLVILVVEPSHDKAGPIIVHHQEAAIRFREPSTPNSMKLSFLISTDEISF
jgi:hypothetical protein